MSGAISKRHLIALSPNKSGYIQPGRFDPAIQELAKNLPGRRRWHDGKLVFENVASNWIAVHEVFRDENWSPDAINCVNRGDKHEESKALLLMKRMQELPPKAAHWGFRMPPMAHQLLAWYISRSEEYFAYFMDMGTGKTKTTIDVAAWMFLAGKIDAVAVVAPNGVHRQWINQQVPEHMPAAVKFKALTIGTRTARSKREEQMFTELLQFQGLKVAAINCEAISHAAGVVVLESFLLNTRCLLVIDESRRFGNPSAVRTKQMMKLAKMAPYRRILTGTPMTRGIEDLYAQYNILSPDILGYTTFTAFRNRYCVMGGFEGREIVGYQREEELQRKVAPYTFRVTKEECLDLPPKVYMIREFSLTEDQSKMYKELSDELITAIDTGVIDVQIGAALLMKLTQLACGFLMAIPEEETGLENAKSKVLWRADPNPRIEALMDAINEASDQPTIIWCRFREDILQVTEALRSAGKRFVAYTGGLKPEQQDQLVSDFMGGRADYFVGQVDAGGTGLNLQRATLVIYYSNSRNPESRWQSEDRAHRKGQTSSVTYVDLIAMKTVDKRILEQLKAHEATATKTLKGIKDLLLAASD
jgi:hypothetical protein